MHHFLDRSARVSRVSMPGAWLACLCMALFGAACGDDGNNVDNNPDAAPEVDAPDGPQPSPLAGHYVSPICEARPDGQGGYNYVKRDFTFNEDDTWTGTIDFYSDDTCATPVSTASIGGGFEFDGDAAVYDAQAARFALDIFKLTPRAQSFVDFLNTAPEGTCGQDAWAIDVEQDILFTGGCSVLGIDHAVCPAEYELVYVLGGQLFFGARPEDGGNLCTVERRPVSLQTPMLADDGVIDTSPATDIVGHWTSPACESRPDGQGGYRYVKRDFTFNNDDTWTGTIDFYEDSACATRTSTANIGGAYALGDASARVHGATEAQFNLDSFTLTPRAQSFADFLNTADPGTCGQNAWEVDVEQDIVVTNGCSVLGIVHDACPAEYELVHILEDRLHFGGRPEDGGNLCTPERRPITLQTPMLRAGN